MKHKVWEGMQVFLKETWPLGREYHEFDRDAKFIHSMFCKFMVIISTQVFLQYIRYLNQLKNIHWQKKRAKPLSKQAKQGIRKRKKAQIKKAILKSTPKKLQPKLLF